MSKIEITIDHNNKFLFYGKMTSNGRVVEITNPTLISELVNRFAVNKVQSGLANFLIEDELYISNDLNSSYIKPNVPNIKENKKRLLTMACSNACLGGVMSSVLGSLNFYPTTLVDQQNYALAASSGAEATFWCASDSKEGTWNFVTHTPDQTKALGAEITAFISGNRSKLKMLVDQVVSISDESTDLNAQAIRSIVW